MKIYLVDLLDKEQGSNLTLSQWSGNKDVRVHLGEFSGSNTSPFCAPAADSVHKAWGHLD